MTVAIFPALIGLAFPVKRSPIWLTDPQQAVSGKRTRLARWTYPQYKYEVSHKVLRSGVAQTEWQSLLAFYNLMNGSNGLFQYADPDDGVLGSDQRIGTGDGVSTTFQMVRAMSGALASFVEPVFAPTGSPVIKVGGVVVSNYTIGSDANGVPGNVIFNAAVDNGATIVWAKGGTFNWWCRFDDDTAEFDKFMSGFWQQQKLSFTTEKF